MAATRSATMMIPRTGHSAENAPEKEETHHVVGLGFFRAFSLLGRGFALSLGEQQGIWSGCSQKAFETGVSFEMKRARPGHYIHNAYRFFVMRTDFEPFFLNSRVSKLKIFSIRDELNSTSFERP